MCMQTSVAHNHPLNIVFLVYVKLQRLVRFQPMIFHISCLKERICLCKYALKASDEFYSVKVSLFPK